MVTKDELNRGVEFSGTEEAFEAGYAGNAKVETPALPPERSGRSKRGRPTMEQAYSISPEEAKRRKAVANSLRVQRSKRKAKARALYPDGGTLLELELAA